MTTILSNSPVSPLRQKLIDDMTMRHFSAATQRNYIRDVGRFASFLRRSPDTATIEDVRQFQLAQSEAGVPVPTMNTVVSALRFFFANTLDRPDLARKLVRVSHPRNLPVVLSRDEMARLLNATTSLKHQAALSVAYGAGLRVGEVAMLKVRDIDSERMLIRVEHGKGGRYRNAMLSPDLLTLLRQWWQHGHRQGVLHRDGWLFPGQYALKPISTRQLYRSRPPTQPRLPGASVHTHCGTASPRICWKTASMSASSRCCSAMPSSRRRRSIPRWQRARCVPLSVRSTSWASSFRRRRHPTPERCAPPSRLPISSGLLVLPIAWPMPDT
jgi:integrase/recombinase XerD